MTDTTKKKNSNKATKTGEALTHEMLGQVLTKLEELHDAVLRWPPEAFWDRLDGQRLELVDELEKALAGSPAGRGAVAPPARRKRPRE